LKNLIEASKENINSGSYSIRREHVGDRKNMASHDFE